jgi:hypothetical protein
MDNKRSIEVISPQPKPQRGFFSILIFLYSYLSLLASRFQLTKEEQQKAGIHLPGQRYK